MHGEEKASLEFLARVLGSDKDPRVRGAAIEAVGASIEGLEAVPQPGAGKATGAASPAETLLLERLEDPDWGVQLLAVRLVDEKHLTKAVPYLINALTKATPRLAIAIGSALRSLTRENFEDYARPWALWWEDHKEEFETKDHRVFPPGAKVWPDAFFYGIRIRSDRVLFVIDTSASMKLATRNPNPAAPWRPPPQAGGGMPPPPPPEEILSGPKIDVARHELKKAIQKLPRTAKFNIIAFNTGVYSWRDTMQVADDATKKEALAWIRALQPKGLTFLDGALRLAFRMAGLPACGWVGREADVDTIVLLSDGLPTTDEPIDAKLMDPERILEHVQAWNRHGRIVVNCIAVSDVEDLDFLRVLAERNGGEFVDR